MAFIKKVFVGLSLIAVLYLGGSGAQSNSLFMQGLGFVGLLAGLLILYIFGKMVLRGLGCMMATLILALIAMFMMYTFGLFNNGIGGLKDSLLSFIGTEQSVKEEKPRPVQKKNKPDKKTEQTEEDASPKLYGAYEEDVEIEPVEEAEPQGFNPMDYPAIYGSARVLNADTLVIQGYSLVLFGIDAPEPKQTCADGRGRSYNCGQQAANWLKSWIKDNEIECHVLDQDKQGKLLGTCNYGPYDLGAALVNAGWAVANTAVTDIYYPYEMQAQKARRGLWQGKFYKPWDWRRIQSRKATIKVIEPPKRLKGIFG